MCSIAGLVTRYRSVSGRVMVSHTSTAVALALRASTPVQPGKTRICISGFAKYSHNTGHSKKLADAVVKAYPQQHETWYHMASTDLEVCAPLALRMHRAPTKSPRLASFVLAMSATKSRVAAIRLHNRSPLFSLSPHTLRPPHTTLLYAPYASHLLRPRCTSGASRRCSLPRSR